MAACTDIFGRKFVDLCDVSDISSAPKSIRVEGDSVVVRMNVICNAKHAQKSLDSAPEGVECHINKYGFLHATMEKRVSVAELKEHDFNSETLQFLENVRNHLGLKEDEKDSGNWILIPEKSVADKLLEFCESDKMYAALVCDRHEKGEMNSFFGSYIYKLPLCADRFLLMLREYPDAEHAPVFRFYRKCRQQEMQIGCYFRKEKKLCLFGDSTMLCEYIAQYIDRDETRVKVFHENEAISPVVMKLVESVDSAMDKTEAFFYMLTFVKSKCSISFDDVEAFMNDKMDFVEKMVNNIWNDEQNRYEIKKILSSKT